MAGIADSLAHNLHTGIGEMVDSRNDVTTVASPGAGRYAVTNNPERRHGVVSAATTTVAEAGRYAVTNNLNVSSSCSFIDTGINMCVTISHMRIPSVVCLVATACSLGGN